LARAWETPMPPHLFPPSLSSTASLVLLLAPLGDMPTPTPPLVLTTALTVGLPRESRARTPLTLVTMKSSSGKSRPQLRQDGTEINDYLLITKSSAATTTATTTTAATARREPVTTGLFWPRYKDVWEGTTSSPDSLSVPLELVRTAW